MKFPLPKLSRSQLWFGALCLVVLFLVGYSWMSLGVSAPNERSRIYLAVAMVDHGELTIDKPVARWGRMFDMSRVEDKWYSNKPLGISLIGVPLYATARLFSEASQWTIEELLLLYRFAFMLPVTLLGLFAFYHLLLRLGLREASAQLGTLGWFLATPAFHYTGAYFSHQIVAICLITGTWLILRTSQEREERGRRRSDYLAMAAAGAVLGIAGMSEYQAGVACALIALYMLSLPNLRDISTLAAFGLGVVPCIVALGMYNNAVFGGPLQLSYKHPNKQGYAELGDFTLPKWEHFKGLMFSSHRGLLVIAPWLMLAPAGAVWLWRNGQKRVAALGSAIVLFWILLISGYGIWYGGWGYGPRHLVASVGIMSLLAAGGLEWTLQKSKLLAGLAAGLIIAGLLQMQIMEAFIAELPPGLKNPIVDVAYLMAKEGITAPNLLWPITDWPALYTLVPLGVVVLAVAVYLIWRAVSAAPQTGWLKSSAAVVLALIPALVLGWMFYKQGPSGKDPNNSRFIGMTKDWAEKDKAFFAEDSAEERPKR